MVPVDLTEKEKRVMDFLIQGRRDKEIASLIGRRPRTVTRIVCDVCNKLGADTRAQAVAIYCAGRIE